MFGKHEFTLQLDHIVKQNNKKSDRETLVEGIDVKYNFKARCSEAGKYSLTKKEFEEIMLQGNYKIIKSTGITKTDGKETKEISFNIFYIDFTNIRN